MEPSRATQAQCTGHAVPAAKPRPGDRESVLAPPHHGPRRTTSPAPTFHVPRP